MAQAGIGRRLQQHHLGRLAQRLAPLAEVAAVDELGLDAPLRQDLLDDVVAGAEQGVGCDHAVAGFHQAGDRREHRRHAAGGGARGLGAFQQRHALLEHRDGRVAEAAIDEARLGIVERGLRLFRGLVDVAGRHVDRLGGLGMLRAGQAAMHHLGGETPIRGNVVLVVLHHPGSPWIAGEMPRIQAQKNPDRNKGRGGLEDARHLLAAYLTWPQSGPNHHVSGRSIHRPAAKSRRGP